MYFIGERMPAFSFCGASSFKLSLEGSSILMLVRSTRTPNLSINSLLQPGMVLT